VARLLMAAILDNTLNFTAKITKIRDKDAYNKLQKIVGDKDFEVTYFKEIQNKIENDLESSIVNDIKIENICNNLPKTLGQLTIYDISTILDKVEFIKNIMCSYDEKWLINIICLKENKSYIICSDINTSNNLEKIFKTIAKDNVIILEPAILRKEIMRIALEAK